MLVLLIFEEDDDNEEGDHEADALDEVDDVPTPTPQKQVEITPSIEEIERPNYQANHFNKTFLPTAT